MPPTAGRDVYVGETGNTAPKSPIAESVDGAALKNLEPLNKTPRGSCPILAEETVALKAKASEESEVVEVIDDPSSVRKSAADTYPLQENEEAARAELVLSAIESAIATLSGTAT